MFYPGSDIKSLIIELLADKGFMSAKEIHSGLAQYYKNDVTHQAIYKNLQHLRYEGILVRHGYHYTFSLLYMNKMRAFCSRLTNNVSHAHKCAGIVQQIEERVSIRLTLKSILGYYNYSRELLLDLMMNHPDENTFYEFHTHYAFLQLPTEKDFADYIFARKFTTCMCINGITRVDQRSKRILEDNNVESKLVSDACLDLPDTEYTLFKDYVISAQFERGYMQKYSSLLQKENIDSFPSTNFKKFVRGGGNDCKIIVSVEKNINKAHNLKSKMLTIMY